MKVNWNYVIGGLAFIALALYVLFSGCIDNNHSIETVKYYDAPIMPSTPAPANGSENTSNGINLIAGKGLEISSATVESVADGTAGVGYSFNFTFVNTGDKDIFFDGVTCIVNNGQEGVDGLALGWISEMTILRPGDKKTFKVLSGKDMSRVVKDAAGNITLRVEVFRNAAADVRNVIFIADANIPPQIMKVNVSSVEPVPGIKNLELTVQR